MTRVQPAQAIGRVGDVDNRPDGVAHDLMTVIAVGLAKALVGHLWTYVTIGVPAHLRLPVARLAPGPCGPARLHTGLEHLLAGRR